jgi:OOP family OmpA-OmpF porin
VSHVQRYVVPIPIVKPEPKIIYANNNECSIKISLPDLDRDGIEDSVDQCPATPCNFTVDHYGCPVKSTLEINFETSSAAIRDYSISKIQRFADFLIQHPGSLVKIVGHTDSRGSKSVNYSLSHRRAMAVVQELINLGVSSSRLTAIGKGEAMAIASNKTASGRAKNRRIEAELSYPKGRS